MKYTIILIILLTLTLVNALNISTSMSNNVGNYINQSLIISNNSEVTLSCNPINSTNLQLSRELIIPDGTIITINSEKYKTEKNDINLNGEYIFRCSSKDENYTESLILKFNVNIDKENNINIINSNQHNWILIIFLSLIGIIIIIGLLIWLSNL